MIKSIEFAALVANEIFFLLLEAHYLPPEFEVISFQISFVAASTLVLGFFQFGLEFFNCFDHLKILFLHFLEVGLQFGDFILQLSPITLQFLFLEGEISIYFNDLIVELFNVRILFVLHSLVHDERRIRELLEHELQPRLDIILVWAFFSVILIEYFEFFHQLSHVLELIVLQPFLYILELLLHEGLSLLSVNCFHLLLHSFQFFVD